jgi:hypothetical protein
MSLDELQTYAAQLQAMVLNWTAISQDPGNNSTETNNSLAIVQILQGRLDEYNRQIAQRTTATTETDATIYPQDPLYTGGPAPATSGGTSILLLLGIAAGAWLLFGKSKGRKNQVATRKKITRK